MTNPTTAQTVCATIHSYANASSFSQTVETTQQITNTIDAEKDEIRGILVKHEPFRFDYYKVAIPLANFFSILVEETLDLTDSDTKLVKKQVSETLNLTDSVTKFKKVIRQVNETLDLVDAQSKKVMKTISETLGLTDTRTKLVKKSINETLSLVDTPTKLIKRTIAETLSLVDTQSKKISRTIIESLALTDVEQNKSKKLVQEVLDLVDNASRVFISGGGVLFQRLVEETLDLVDSVSSVFTSGSPPPTTPGTGRYPLPPAKESKPFKRPALVYRHLIRETLDLKDSVTSLAKHYNLIPKLITTVQVRESLSLFDEVTVRVIRTGRKAILENMKSILELLMSPIAVGAELDRIKVNLSKTNRGAVAIQEQLSKDLIKKLNKITNEYIKDKFMPLDSLKQKHEAEIYGMIRLAVESSYVLAVNYVRKAVKDNTVYLSGTDIEKIKSETQRISDIFWRNAFDYINGKDLENKMKNMPVAIGGFFDTITNVVKSVVEFASFGTVQKATTTKLQQIPKSDAIDPITNIATVQKRIVVFVTKKDEKVCPICVRYEGVEYLEDDPFIVRPIEDTHPNCRCRLLIKGTDSDIITG